MTQKTKFFILSILIMAVFILVGSACFNEKNNQSAEDGGASLESILGKAAGVNSLSYDMVSTFDGQTRTQKMMIKGQNMRTETLEEGQKMIFIINSQQKTAYTLMPNQNIAMAMDFGEFEQEETPLDAATQLMDYNPQIIGTETIDGKKCTVVQYQADQTTMKQWIWQEYGLAIKTESTGPQGSFVVEFKNYDFSDIPDSMFELPQGVQIMEFPGFDINI